MSSRVVKQMYLSLIEYSMLFIHKQSRFVCDTGGMSATVGGVLFGSESYQNDRYNSCQSMNILSIEYSHVFQSCKTDVFESS